MIPEFFMLRQQFERPVVQDVAVTVHQELSRLALPDLTGKRVAISAGSRGIKNIDAAIKACVDFLQSRGAEPFVVPAMGSHGGATPEGQKQVLQTLGITESSLGCPIHSSMDVVQVCEADEGFPVYFDQHAWNADHVLVVNRIKPHTRFAGAIESGLMKMMLIGLGKQKGAEVYHRVIMNYSFDQIVRSVAKEVIARCNVLGGVALLENAYEETAVVETVPVTEIESAEARLLERAKSLLPKLPFEHADLLIVDQIGKNISGTGMDTNVIGRKRNDHAAIEGDSPDIHHIFVRDLTPETHGNASGIGLAELTHRRVVEKLDRDSTNMNCITAGHVVGAMLPIDFPSDRQAIETACQISGYLPADKIKAMWILDTLHLEHIACSQVFESAAREAGLEIVSPARALEFDDEGNLKTWFTQAKS